MSTGTEHEKLLRDLQRMLKIFLEMGGEESRKRQDHGASL